MTDRELLEAAATAARISVEFNDHGTPGTWGEWRGLPQWEDWNPLTDDGDALRLAVTLDLPLCPESVNGSTWVCRGELQIVESHHASNPYAATRRAIVRAAAAMAGEKR